MLGPICKTAAAQGYRTLLRAASFGRTRLEAWAARDVFRTEVRGFALELYNVSLPVPLIVNKVAAAVDLIDQYDPAHFAKTRRLISRFTLLRLRRPGSFIPGSATCYLDSHFVLERSPGELAMVIVHESTHASLYARGVMTFRKVKNRIERRCVIEELTFSERLHARERANLHVWIQARQRTLAALSSAVD